MSSAWTPTLYLHETAGRVRLSLSGLTHGDGPTLQEAADDLVARLLNVAFCFRASGFRLPTELGATDVRWLDYVWELGELAARGDDIRERVFGEAA